MNRSFQFLLQSLKPLGRRLKEFCVSTADRFRMLELELAADELRSKMEPYETEMLSQRRVLSTRDASQRENVRQMVGG